MSTIKLVEILINNPQPKNPKKRQDITAALRAGKYDRVNPLIGMALQWPNKPFPIYDDGPSERSVVLMEVTANTETSDVLALMAYHRLERPTYWDGFLLGAQHPDQQRSGKIVLLHEPPLQWSGNAFRLALTTEQNGPRLPALRTITLLTTDNWWSSGTRFLFRKKEKMIQ